MVMKWNTSYSWQHWLALLKEKPEEMALLKFASMAVFSEGKCLFLVLFEKLLLLNFDMLKTKFLKDGKKNLLGSFSQKRLIAIFVANIWF